MDTRATVSGGYFLLLYPRPELAAALRDSPSLAEDIWHALNSLPANDLIDERRVCGGGLHKLEPKELAKVPANVLADLLRDSDVEVGQLRLAP